MAGAEVLTYGDDGNQMPCACVDIGTNTTRLLVAELDGARVREVVAVRRFLRLVPGDDGAIPAEAVAELAAIVAAHVRRRAPARRARGAGRGHRGDPRRAQPRRALRGGAPRRRRPRRGPHRASRRRRWPSPGRWPRWRSPPAGTIGVIDVGGGSSELVTGHRARRRHVVDVAADRLRDAGRAPPALRSARARRAGRGAGRDRRRARRACIRPRPRCPRRGRQRHDAGGGRRRRARAGHDRAHPGGPDRRAGGRGGQAAGAARRARAPAAGRACWRSRRPGEPSARRPCRSRWAACARASSCGHSTVVVEWWLQMAKARDIPGLHAELSYREAAASTVAVRTQELFDHAEGVLDTSDIERVHDMRVATRRLRAVLEIYEPCFSRKALRDVLDDVKALADALGERRDPDVHLAQLEEFADRRQGGRPPRGRGLRRARARRAGRRQRGARRRPGRDPGDRPARPARALAASASPEHDPRRSFGLQRPQDRPPEVPREGARRQGPRSRRDAGRQPRAHRRHAPGRAVLVRSPGARPGAHEGAARHAHRGQAPALHPRGRRRAVLRPLRRRPRSSAPRTCRTCSASCTTATSSSRACAPCRTSCAPPTRWRRAPAPADAPDLDPTLASGTPHAPAWRGLETLRIYVEARRGLLFERFLEMWRELEREGFRARLEYAISERPDAANPAFTV